MLVCERIRNAVELFFSCFHYGRICVEVSVECSKFESLERFVDENSFRLSLSIRRSFVIRLFGKVR